MAFEHAVVLTGGIATGKSSATTFLSLFGFRFIDADSIAHVVLDGQCGAIARLFGDAYCKEGTVDREQLGKMVFADSSRRRQLESLVHPLIREEIKRQADEQERYAKPYIIDIPLFFEKEGYPIERSIVVYAPRHLQIERLIKREGFSEEEALQRIDAQMSIETKRDKAAYVIDNSGDLTQLQNECEWVKEAILNDFEAQ